MNQPKPQFLQVTTPRGSIVFVNIHAIRRAEYFPANDNGGSMLFLDTPGGQATSLADEADALWALLQPLAVEQPTAPGIDDMHVAEDYAAWLNTKPVQAFVAGAVQVPSNA